MKGLFIPEITAEMFRNGCLEGIEALMAEGEIYDIDYTGWIPVSERLPRARESVLLAVNHKYGNWVGEGCYWETTDNHIIWKGYRWNATYWDDEIIAWMPLPKPYREDGELNV